MMNLIKIIFLLIILVNPISAESKTSIIPYYIEQAAKVFDIDPTLMFAICSVESRCVATAINKNDAQLHKKRRGIREYSHGMFQIKLATARGLGFRGTSAQLRDPEVNSWYAAKLLRHLYIRYKDTAKVASAYNAGFYTHTNLHYVNLVLRRLVHYKLDKRYIVG